MLVVRFPTVTHFRIRSLEWVIALMMLLWWVVLIQPESTFKNQPQLFLLARTFSEDVWAWICFTIASTRLAALYVNGAWTPSPWFRTATALISSVFWLWITIGMMASGLATTGLTVYPILFFCDLYSVSRASQDARLSREARMNKPEAPIVIPTAE